MNDIVNKIVWDLDGTVVYNFLDLDFLRNIKIFGEEHESDLIEFRKHNKLNYSINISDVKHILTGRVHLKEGVTREEMAKHGIDADLVMFDGDKHDVDKIIKFKSDYLNKIKAMYYVDDDVVFCKKLELYLKVTKTISTEELYRDFLEEDRVYEFKVGKM